jgi:hypothetical protein
LGANKRFVLKKWAPRPLSFWNLNSRFSFRHLENDRITLGAPTLLRVHSRYFFCAAHQSSHDCVAKKKAERLVSPHLQSFSMSFDRQVAFPADQLLF